MDTGVGAGHVIWHSFPWQDCAFKTLPLRPFFQGDLCSKLIGMSPHPSFMLVNQKVTFPINFSLWSSLYIQAAFLPFPLTSSKMLSIQKLVWYLNYPLFRTPPFHSARQTCRLVGTQHILSDSSLAGYHLTYHRLPCARVSQELLVIHILILKIYFEKNSSSLKICLIFLWFACIILNLYLFSLAIPFFFLSQRPYHPMI